METASAALLAAAIVRLWLMPLGSSFWVDEMATEFVVRHGASDPSLAAAPQVPHSIYYALPRASAALFGHNEVAYRLPSVLLMGIALLLIARLAARLIHPRAGWFAAFACLALSGFNFQAADARPYGLGVLVSAAAVLFLIRWLDSARWREALLFALLAAMLWRVQLIFWPFYGVFAIYAAVRLYRGETRVGWLRAGAVFTAVALALIPVAADALALLRQAHSHVITRPPSFHAFEHELRWNLVLICGLGAWLLARLLRWAEAGKTIGASSLALILGWWLCQPLALYAFSRITGESVFVRRYLSLMLPGVALCATAAVARFAPYTEEAGTWRKLGALMGAGVLVLMGQWGILWPPHGASEWRGAARAVNEMAPAGGAPVICPSPFIEARPPEWRPDYHLPGFLYCHLPVYPIRGGVRLFPFDASPEAEKYAASLTGGELRASRRFVVYGGAGAVNFWRKWFARRRELEGWSFRRHEFGDVEVVEFNAPR
ncbi:MAG: glycosyltransferase family 39 protein [Acidobacteriia bacterium]|nr:glycosyltransferase family 39 protein [Terriglobia bacterium]